MFAVSMPTTLFLDKGCGFFISRLFGVAALAALPQWISAPCAEVCRWRDEERAASFFAPIQQYSVMPTTLNPAQREKQSTSLHTCPSHETALQRLETLRQSIKSWMETTIRSEFPEATKTRYRLRKGRRGRIVFHASVRSRGIYLHFRSHTLQGLSRQITSAAAIHRTHNSNPTI